MSGLVGTVAPGLEPVREAVETLLEEQPDWAFQLAAEVRGERVVDLAAGLGHDDLVPVFSSSKGAVGTVVALLVARGQLALDDRVAVHWPEFAAAGKAEVTVRQALSHSAGLPAVDGGYTWDELLAHTPLAQRLAAQRPLWQPGAALGYHALTIGALADELVRRTDGRTLGQVLAQDVAVDVHLGQGPELDDRVRPVLLPTDEELLAWSDRLPLPSPDSLGAHTAPRDGAPLWLRVNDEDVRRAGPPAAGGLASARGLAAMYSALDALVPADVLAQVGALQVHGTDLAGTEPLAFAVVFQKNWPRATFGSHRAFGHDGLGGSIGFRDPLHDLSFGYVPQRIPLPGGVDARAVALSAVLRDCLR